MYIFFGNKEKTQPLLTTTITTTTTTSPPYNNYNNEKKNLLLLLSLQSYHHHNHDHDHHHHHHHHYSPLTANEVQSRDRFMREKTEIMNLLSTSFRIRRSFVLMDRKMAALFPSFLQWISLSSYPSLPPSLPSFFPGKHHPLHVQVVLILSAFN